MCDVLIPALIGVAALGLLGGGGIGGGANGCDNCPTGPVCAVTQVGNETITIPQLAGEGTNVVQVSAQHHSYQSQPSFNGSQPYHQASPAPYAPAPAGPSYYAPNAGASMGHPGHYGAMAPAPGYDAGASINYDGQSAIGAGTYSTPGGAGIGANVGDLNVGLGAQSY